MPTRFYFNNKKVTLPGVYSRILSGRQNPPQDLDYGTLLIIDNTSLGTPYPSPNNTLTNNGIRGGAGVAGTKTQGKDSIYELNSLADFRDFVGYGWWWKAAEYLFSPSGTFAGVSKIYVIKPATTVPSLLTFTATGGGANGGTFKVKTLDESAAANGVLTSTKLTSGYAYTIETGVVDTAKWIYKIWVGTYKGNYAGIDYDDISLTTASNSPELVAQSPEFNNIQELITWANTDSIFGSRFYLDPTSAVAGTGAVNQADVTAVAGFQVSTGGSATYDKMNEALAAVTDLDYNFVMTTASGAVHSDTNVLKIKTHILTEAKYDKFLIVNGDETSLTNSKTSATSLNSDRVILVHGAIRKQNQSSADGYYTWGSFFHTCMVAGRIMGLAPQIPVTFKSLDIDKMLVELTSNQLEQALNTGVLTSYYDTIRREHVVLQGINTLQNNTYQLNADGTTFSIQLRRIAAQINKELVVFITRDLLSDPLGVNRNTLSPTDLKEYVRGYLSRKLANDTADNLLISFQNITVTRDQDAYFCTYEFVANSEINKIFLTGFML